MALISGAGFWSVCQGLNKSQVVLFNQSNRAERRKPDYVCLPECVGKAGSR